MKTIYFTENKGSNKVINYGQYQRQGPGKRNTLLNLQRVTPPDKDEFTLSEKNQRQADKLTQLTLNSYTRQKENGKPNKSSIGLNYLI